jgi:hypothetical protein
MEARDLQHAFEAEVAHRGIVLPEEEVIVDEIGHRSRMDEQRRFERRGIRLGQRFQLVHQLGKQLVGGLRCRDRVADLLFDVDRLGKRTKVEPDHGALQPAPGGRDDFVGGGRIGVGGDHFDHRLFLPARDLAVHAANGRPRNPQVRGGRRTRGDKSSALGLSIR